MSIMVSKPYLTDECKFLAEQAIRESSISGLSGKYVEKFEKCFSEFVGTKYAVACSNGTTALHLALIGADVRPGDEVLVADLTNMATFFAVNYTGATAVPVDINIDTYTVDCHDIVTKITEKTKAIIIVHLFGQPADISSIMHLLQSKGIKIIEDCAEAHGSQIGTKMVGSLGDFGAFSFFGNKNLTSGEGGIVTTNSAEKYSKLCNLRSLAFGTSGNKFIHEEMGYNYRLSNIHAAIAYSQTKNAKLLIKRRIEVCEHYDFLFKDVDEVITPVKRSNIKNTYWMYHIRLNEKLSGSRDMVTKQLLENGIETRNGFVPYTLQKKIKHQFHGTCKKSKTCSETTFYIPTYLEIEEEKQIKVVSSIKEILFKLSK